MAISWTNTTVKLGELKPWADNPRCSTKKQAKRILESFDKFGQVQTIAVSPTLDVYDGHQRLSALLTIYGADYTVDARQSDRPLTDDERRQLVITLHTGATGAWDWDLLSGWDAGQLMTDGFDVDALKDWKRDVTALDSLLKSEEPPVEDAEPQIDKAEELRQKWGVELGQMWRLGSHRIICGDCTDKAVVDRVMGGEKAVLCVTDPPYAVNYDPQWRVGVGVGGEQRFANGSVIANDDNKSWINAFDAIPADVLYCWTADVTLNWLQGELENRGFAIAYLIIWKKDLAVFGRGDYHHKYEPCLYMVRNGCNHHWNGDRKQETVWDIPTIHSFANGHNSNDWGLVGHGNQKPLDCMMKPIINNSVSEEIIYEPFSGSGTTIIACENLKRKCRAIEISAAYVAVTIQRWVDVSGGTPELVTQEERKNG